MSTQQLTPIIPDLASSQMIVSLDLAAIASTNPTLAHPLLVALLAHSNSDFDNGQSSYHLPSPFLDVLPYLPPTLATFDLFGRLLRDQTPAGGTDALFTVANVVRVEVLGRFVHESIGWLEMAEREEREGGRSDDRFAKGVQNVGDAFITFYVRWLTSLCVALQVLPLAHQAWHRRPGIGC